MKKFFPLIALLVVIAYLLADKLGNRGEAYANAARLNQQLIAQALRQYFNDHQTYPNEEEGLSALLKISPASKAAYLRGVPRDPWGNAFIYKRFGQACTIISYGADATEGGEGENSDISTYVSQN